MIMLCACRVTVYLCLTVALRVYLYPLLDGYVNSIPVVVFRKAKNIKVRTLSTFQTNFDEKLLVHFYTLLAGRFFYYSIFVLFLSRWIEIEIK